MKKSTILLLIIVIGLVLRFIAAGHTDVGTDELPHAVRAIDIIEAGRLSSLDQVPLYLYLTDIGYKIFGVNGFSTRITNILFGALSSILIFFIARRTFSKDIAIIAATLFSISAYTIMFNTEPDMLGVFFTLFSIYFYIRGLQDNQKYFFASALFLGIGILAKNISAFVLPTYILFYIIYDYKHSEKPLIDFKKKKLNLNKSFLRTMFWSAIILIITVSPILIFNYFLYKYNGILDLIVARSLKIPIPLYEQFFGGLRDWSFTLDWGVTKQVVRKIFLNDMVIASLSLLGILFSFSKEKRKNYWVWLFILSIIIPFLLLTGSAGPSKTHFLYIMPMIVIFAAVSVKEIAKRIKIKNTIWTILGIILIINLFLLQDSLTEPSGMIELRKITQNFEDFSLVVVDSRTWNGRNAWALNDKHYLESNNFPNLFNQINEFPGPFVNVPTYFVECVNDDCGWGRGLKENKAIQEGTEKIVDLFSQNGQLVSSIKGKSFSFNIYKIDLNLKQSIFPTVDSTHQFFMNSIGWKEMEKMPDYYQIEGAKDKILDWGAHLALYLAILISLLSIPLLYFLYQKEK